MSFQGNHVAGSLFIDDLDNMREPQYMCHCCLNDVEGEDDLHVLGIETYGLKPNAMVCGFCLNELHNNLTLTN